MPHPDLKSGLMVVGKAGTLRSIWGVGLREESYFETGILANPTMAQSEDSTMTEY